MIRRVLRDERGAMLPVIALSVVALIGATSLTIDVGRLASRQRDLQAIADVVALDAASALVGADLPSLVTGDFDVALVDAVERNGVDVVGAPEPGRVAEAADDFVPSADPALTDVNAWRLDGADDTTVVAVAGLLDGTGAFEPMAVPASPSVAVGAVAVWAGDQVDYVFGVGRALTDRSGIAEALASSGLGMWASLASIDTPGEQTLLGSLLGSFLGVDASLVDPAGLADASLTLGGLATELGLASVEELLAADVALADLLVAESAVLTAGGDTVAADMLGGIAASVDGALSLNLVDIVTIDQYGSAAATSAGLDALGLLTATAMLVARDPPHAIAVDAAVLGMPLSLTIIEPPMFAFGPEGTTVQSAQISLSFDRILSLDTGPLTQEQCLDILPLLPCVPTLVEVLHLFGSGIATITVDVAAGEAVLDRLTCSPAGDTAALDVTTSAVSVDVPVSIPLTATGVVGTIAGGSVSLAAAAELLGSTTDDLPFGGNDTPFDQPVHLDGGTSLLAFDLSGVEVELAAPVLGVSLSVGTPAEAVVSALVDDVLAPLNSVVIGLLTELDGLGIGIGIGGAEVVAATPTCDLSRLVG